MRDGDFNQLGVDIYDPLTGDENAFGRTQFPNNTIPMDRFDPINQSLINGEFGTLPLPNIASAELNNNNYLGEGSFEWNRFTLDTKVLDKALVRIGKLSSDNRLKLTVNGSVTLATWDAELGEAEIEVPVVASNHSGEDFVTGFDGSYLRDAIKVGNGTVDVGLGEALTPMRMDGGEGRVAVVMPMRV